MTIPDWERAHGRAVAIGSIRNALADFQVDEILGFEPDGQGEHDFLWIEKRNANTAWVARQLAAHAGIPARDVGHAGMKDRHAITRQWFSVRRPATASPDWQEFRHDEIRVVRACRNSRKLRTGAHSGNRFRIVVRDFGGDLAEVEARLKAIRTKGVPNYFGEQRFGRNGHNIELALSLFAGKRLKREKRSIAISAARSLLFNAILEARVQDASWDRLDTRDLAALDGSNSVFVIDALDDTIWRRLAEQDIHPSAELWGRALRPRGSCELAIAARYPDIVAGLEAVADAGHRATRLAVRDLQWSVEDRSLALQFRLARGGFATAVLRELVSYTTASAGNQSGSSST